MTINRQTFDELLDSPDISNIIRTVCSKFVSARKRLEREDLSQQARIILINNFNIINERFDGDLLLFCRYALANHLRNYIREITRDAIYKSVQLHDDEQSEHDENERNIIQCDPEDQSILLAVCDAISTLTDREREILDLVFMRGYTCREAGQYILNMKQQRVDFLKQAALVKLRNALGVTNAN